MILEGTDWIGDVFSEQRASVVPRAFIQLFLVSSS